MMHLNPPSWLRVLASDAGDPSLERAQEIGAYGALLFVLRRLGMPVPPGFVLTSGLGQRFRRDARLPSGFDDIAQAAVSALQPEAGFGEFPPLVRVVGLDQDGGRVEFPDVGLNHQTVRGLVRRTGNPRQAWERYRALIATIGRRLHGIPDEVFRDIVERQRAEDGCPERTSLGAEGVRQTVRRTLTAYELRTGAPFPHEPAHQLRTVVEWLLTRPDASGRRGDPAPIVVLSEVYGEAGARSGSGLAYTRDPATGDDRLLVDFLFNGAPDDLLAGRGVTELGERAPADLFLLPHLIGWVERRGYRDASR